MPLLILLTMLIVQTGLVFHARAVAENAAQEGASAARQYDGTVAAATERTHRYLDELGPEMLSDRSVQVTRTPASVEVTVTGDVVSLVPFVDIGVAETASGPVERYVPPVGP
ncbi:pilus assembly protein [Nocardioides zeae]|uniref:Pilus assembly protein n=1 Tax=Nocardioides imazamoxiresistens TaxID=3231893 RepID=A0ABU3Q0H3_9ACTN|nr:pilus assembly protein [Nocardioides zeae]MDT9594884.1 pilus assembly protein [Nocardioides zeae]